MSDQITLVASLLHIYFVYLSALYEYKERLEHSFMSFKEKKSTILNEAQQTQSELAVLKSSHRNEIQRLHVSTIFGNYCVFMSLYSTYHYRTNLTPVEEERKWLLFTDHKKMKLYLLHLSQHSHLPCKFHPLRMFMVVAV